MRILALDTTSPQGSIALLEDGRVVEEIALDGPDGYAHLLFGAIEEILARNGWTLSGIGGIDLFAAASGPGSFTGVRVGLTAVKGLAEALGKPVAGVSNLKAIASLGQGEHRVVRIDARRGDVFEAAYSGHLELLSPEVVTAREDASGVSPTPRMLAGAVGRLAFADGGVDPAALDANYVRRSDAELFWRDN